MSTTQHPQDEPFNHEAVVRGHQRGESSANLLPDGENAHKAEDYEHTYGDGFYDNMGPSQATLYDDPERAVPFEKEGHSGAHNYQQFGMCVQVDHVTCIRLTVCRIC